MDYLNILLSIFQFIIASMVSPLLFGLQGLGAAGDWTDLYPSSSFKQNFSDGLKCFFGGLSEDEQENKYPEEAHCKYALPLVVIHVLSIIFVGVAVDKIVNVSTIVDALFPVSAYSLTDLYRYRQGPRKSCIVELVRGSLFRLSLCTYTIYTNRTSIMARLSMD
jgi:hypothetical protein